MHADWLQNANLTIALALAAGMLAQSLAVHLRLPGLVLLLAVGVALGPDLADVIRPATLGSSLHSLVGFAVAVILFEGGLNLELKRLRRESRAIRQLVTVGALVTAVSGMLAARMTLGWTWSLSLLFGTLIIVTGPTVITPLLRRLRVTHTVATVLEAEGVLGDALGAIVATVALQVVMRPSGQAVLFGVLDVARRLGTGAGIGAGGGLLIAILLRWRGVVPEGLEKVTTLGLVLATFQLSDAVMHESGIAAAIVAGIVVGNSTSHVRADLVEFEEQLTVMLIGMLFVLLAADVRLADVRSLGSGAVWLVVAVVALVRPLNVLVGTFRTDLRPAEKVFIAWIGPRGIVAAAVASFFATELARAGFEGAAQLRAAVFVVIAVTVLWSGLTGVLVARLLGLRRKRHVGWVILGANGLGRTTARLLMDAGEEVVCVDSNPRDCQVAENAGIRTVYGNANDERVLQRAEVDARYGSIALTPNEEVNFLFTQTVKRLTKGLQLHVALDDIEAGVTPAMVEHIGAAILFGVGLDVKRWSSLIERNETLLDWWRFGGGEEGERVVLSGQDTSQYLSLCVRHAGVVHPLTHRSRLRRGDEVALVSMTVHSSDVGRRLERYGWSRCDR